MTHLEERYRLLVNLGQLINSTLGLRQVFGRSAREIHKLVGCDRVSLLQVKDGRARGGFALEFGDKVRWVDLPEQDLTGTAAQWAVEHRQPRLVRRLDQFRAFEEDDRLFADGYRAYADLPLICRTVVVGVLGLATRQDADADRWDVPFLQELGNVLAIAVDNASAYAEITRLKGQLERENVYLRDEIRTEHDFSRLIGASRALNDVRQAIEHVARTDSTVLIVGETGTGKELIARAIHELSPRREHLLVKVNCAALAVGVIASELFGHEAGAFTGAAKRRVGRFELAQQGSIFLDEVAEIPLETQVLLLRVLQERTIERVGGNQSIPIDVRVIAATNRDLETAVAEGSFRSDLFYRLNVFPIRVPPLRERKEEIVPLVDHFVAQFSRSVGKRIGRVSPKTIQLLKNYHWPGNVRELEHVVERAMILSTDDQLRIDPSWLSGPAVAADRTAGRASLAEQERRAILQALERANGKIYGPGGAAQALGLKPTTLYGKMRKLGVKKKGPSRYI